MIEENQGLSGRLGSDEPTALAPLRGQAPSGLEQSRSSTDACDLRPVMLCGLTWKQARSSLDAVDCAVRRAHWCSPVVILRDGQLTLDDDGEFSPFTFMRGDKPASDWGMVPRLDDEGKPVPPTYRRTA